MNWNSSARYGQFLCTVCSRTIIGSDSCNTGLRNNRNGFITSKYITHPFGYNSSVFGIQGQALTLGGTCCIDSNITFTVPGRAHTNLSIYNIEGRLVKTLLDEEFDGGVKTVVWNGTDSRGNAVSTGVYFYRLRAGGDVMTKKMILLK